MALRKLCVDSRDYTFGRVGVGGMLTPLLEDGDPSISRCGYCIHVPSKTPMG